MSCETQKPVKVVQGEDKIIDLKIRDENGDPYDLTGYSAIEAKFKNTDGTLLTLAVGTGVTVVSAILGRIQLSLTDLQTAELKAGDFMDFEVKITIGTSTQIVQFLRMLSVKKQVA